MRNKEKQDLIKQISKLENTLDVINEEKINLSNTNEDLQKTVIKLHEENTKLKSKFINLPENGKVRRDTIQVLQYEYTENKYYIIITVKLGNDIRPLTYNFNDKKIMLEEYNNLLKQI